MKQEELKQLIYLVCIFLAMSLGISAAGGYYYVNEAKSQKERALVNLESIADLKANEITSWRNERVADARVLHSNPFVRELLRTVILPGEDDKKSPMYEYLDGITREYGYESWIIYDSEHNPVCFSEGAEQKLLHTQPWFGNQSIEEIFISDLHIEKNGDINIDLVIPLQLNQKNYLIVFIIDPSDFLYPLIQSWPGASNSGETMLVEKSGEEILVLNDLRNRKDTAMKLRVPFEEDLPAVKAVNNVSAAMEGRDYRGLPVLAATRHVKGSPWGLVTKIDVEEVLSPLKNRLAFVVISSVMLILVSGIAIIFLWQRQRNAIRLVEAFRYKGIASDLAETRDRLLEAQQIAHLGNWNWDIANGDLTWSDEIYRIFGLKPQEFEATYEAFLEKVHPDDRHIVMEAVDHALSDDAPYNIEHRIVRPDGSVRIVNEAGKVYRDDSGKALQMIGVVHDITERVRSKKKLLSLTAMQEAILDSAGYSIISTTPEGIITSFNKKAEQMLGYKAEEVLGKATPAIIHDMDEISSRAVQFSKELATEIEPGFEVFVAKSRRNLPNEHEWTYVHKNGTRFPVLLSVTAMRDLEGEISGFLGLAADMTRLKETEQEYKTILETAMDGFWIVDHEGRISDTNDAYCKMIGYSRKELLKMRIPDIEAGERPEETAAHMNKIIKTGYDRFESRHRRKDGSIIDVEVCTRFVEEEKGGKFYVFLRDITAQNNARKALIEAKESAERANRTKSEFLANMSHEIRTPMTSILGMAELLTETKLDSEQEEYINRLKHSGDALISIINDILDLSKIEAGRVHLEEIEFNLANELGKVISIFDSKAMDKGIEIGLHIPPELPATFVGDTARLRQVLINVIGNAVKFTDSGKIDVIASSAGCEKGPEWCRLLISVCDTGIGIEAEKLEEIFSEFVQADSSTTRLYGGTGLGLTISKKLVHLMGGSIWAESEEGKGAIFHITLNMKKGNGGKEEAHTAADEHAAPPENEYGLKILLAEDAEDNRLLVNAFLKNTPHVLHMAENGEEAFERFTANKYDLVLMDMQMPVMDGYEATRIIRKWEEEKGLEKTPIIAFTAHALKEEIAGCMKAGCSGHIAKPVKKKTLLQAISEHGIMEKVSQQPDLTPTETA